MYIHILICWPVYNIRVQRNVVSAHTIFELRIMTKQLFPSHPPLIFRSSGESQSAHPVSLGCELCQQFFEPEGRLAPCVTLILSSQPPISPWSYALCSRRACGIARAAMCDAVQCVLQCAAVGVARCCSVCARNVLRREQLSLQCVLQCVLQCAGKGVAVCGNASCSMSQRVCAQRSEKRATVQVSDHLVRTRILPRVSTHRLQNTLQHAATHTKTHIGVPRFCILSRVSMCV